MSDNPFGDGGGSASDNPFGGYGGASSGGGYGQDSYNQYSPQATGGGYDGGGSSSGGGGGASRSNNDFNDGYYDKGNVVTGVSTSIVQGRGE